MSGTTARTALALAGSLAVALAAAGSQAPQAGAVRDDPLPGSDATLRMAFVPGGELAIARPRVRARNDGEGDPVRTVTVDGFWMAVHEITHEQFSPFRMPPPEPVSEAGPGVDGVSRPTPPYEDPAHGMPKANHPAVGMTRWAALHYARWLSLRNGRLYRLPTEAEWEIACRAGGDGPYGFGGDPGALSEHAWFEANSGGVYHPVGIKRPNAFGLHDLHGNVAEWVMNDYDPEGDRSLSAAPGNATVTPVGPYARGIVRGGSFDDPPARLRCDAGQPESPAWKRRDPQIPRSRWWNTDSPHVGFRLVSPAEPLSPAEIRAYWGAVLGP